MSNKTCWHLRHFVRSSFFLLFGFVLWPAHANNAADLDRLLANGQYQEAWAVAEAVLVKWPNDAQMRFVMGVIQLETGKTDEAIATFKKLAADHPQLPEPHNNLAVIFANRGQFEEARAALEVAIQMRPNYARAHENLGDVHARLASEAYGRSLRLEEKNSGIRSKLDLIQSLFAVGGSGGQQGDLVAGRRLPLSTRAGVVVGRVASSGSSATVVGEGVGAVSGGLVSKSSERGVGDLSADSAKEVEEEVRNWASAWSRQDLDVYFGSYARNFIPQGKQSRAAWEESRRARIISKSDIRVEILNLSVVFKGAKANVLFRQKYQSGVLNISSKKMLVLEKTGERWLIVQEISYDE